MLTVHIRTIDSVLAVFDLDKIDHITVRRWFNVEQYARYAEPEIQVHAQFLGKVPKSGRILEVYCIDHSAEESRDKYQMYFFNADDVCITTLL